MIVIEFYNSRYAYYLKHKVFIVFFINRIAYIMCIVSTCIQASTSWVISATTTAALWYITKEQRNKSKVIGQRTVKRNCAH